MEFDDLVRRAMAVRQQYATLEMARYGRAWTTAEIAMGFTGDVGDLIKLLMAHSGVRQIDNVDEKLAHELADCLWSLIVISQMVDINLEQAFLHTMAALETHIAASSLAN